MKNVRNVNIFFFTYSKSSTKYIYNSLIISVYFLIKIIYIYILYIYK